MFDTHIIFADEKPLCVGLMLLLFKSEETNLSVLLKILSVNYRVHLVPVDVFILFISASNMSRLGNVYPQQNCARCSLCGGVLNQPILYWLTRNLTTYFFFMWCDSWHTGLCLPSLGKFIVFTLGTTVCLSALLNGWQM